MGLKDRLSDKVSKTLTQTTEKAIDRATDLADGAVARGKEALQARADGAGPRLSALLRMEDERPTTIEALVVLFVEAVRADGETRELSDRDVFKAAKRRYRRLGALSLPTGPIGAHVVHLYCEAATLCDIVELDGRQLSNELVASHLLVLWNAMPDTAAAVAALDGTGRSVTATLLAHAKDGVAQRLPRKMTKRTALTTLWNLRGAVTDARDIAARGVRQTLFPGARVKQFILAARAELAHR